MRTFCLTVLLLPTVTLAQETTPSTEPTVIYEPVTELEFRDVEVEGTVWKPQVTHVVQRRSASFHPLIKLRTHFQTELVQSAREML